MQINVKNLYCRLIINVVLIYSAFTSEDEKKSYYYYGTFFLFRAWSPSTFTLDKTAAWKFFKLLFWSSTEERKSYEFGKT